MIIFRFLLGIFSKPSVFIGF